MDDRERADNFIPERAGMAAKNRRMLTFDALVAEFAAVRAEGGGEMSKTETCADSTPTPEEKRRGENAVLLEPLKRALRHISHFADTLSPQEVINVCAGALGVDRHDYAGECDPNRSLVELHVERELWRTEHLATVRDLKPLMDYAERMAPVETWGKNVCAWAVKRLVEGDCLKSDAMHALDAGGDWPKLVMRIRAALAAPKKEE